jgi:hypothetical protein
MQLSLEKINSFSQCLFQQKARAKEIFDKHIALRAPDPVNIDSQARKNAEQGLDNVTSDMFKMAQSQVGRMIILRKIQKMADRGEIATITSSAVCHGSKTKKSTRQSFSKKI